MARILLPVDGSKHSQAATRKLIEIVAEWRAKPEILPVFVHLPIPRVGGLGTIVGKSQVARYYEEEGAEALAPCLKILAKAGFASEAQVLVGPIAETVVAQARKSKCDFICVGTRGMTAAANLVMGSVATKIIHIADIPVILIR